MSRHDLEKWSRDNWNKLPDLVRQDCLAELRAQVPAEILAEWKVQHAAGREIGGHMFHFLGGMAVRNILRAQLTDGELPPAHSENYPPEGARNWDDYYIGALQELCETTEAPKP